MGKEEEREETKKIKEKEVIRLPSPLEFGEKVVRKVYEAIKEATRIEIPIRREKETEEEREK